MIALALSGVALAGPALDVPDPLFVGELATLGVEGVPPGSPVAFAASPQVGPGPCLPALGVCVGIVAPVTLGVVLADAGGVATRTVRLPPTAPARVAFQAVTFGPPAAVTPPVAVAVVDRAAWDGDGDGWCAGPACADPTVRPGDCDDTDPRAFPGQPGAFGTPRLGDSGAPSFDFDCDGVEAPTWPSAYTCTPDPGVSGFAQTCDGWTPGWDPAVPAPACGAEGTWHDTCATFRIGGLALCVGVPVEVRVQSCR